MSTITTVELAELRRVTEAATERFWRGKLKRMSKDEMIELRDELTENMNGFPATNDYIFDRAYTMGQINLLIRLIREMRDD